jgi:hypothetical protein
MQKLLMICLFISCWSMAAFGQSFDWQAGVSGVTKNGYHKILLSPDVISKMHLSGKDIRVYSESGTQIPYLFSSEKHHEKISGFKRFPIVRKDYHRSWDWESWYIVQNPKRNTIDHIVLKIRNFDDTKRARISGSNDMGQWFIIKDGYSLHSLYSDTTDHVHHVLRFPLSTYKFYKIEVDNSRHRDPINIVAAGHLEKGYDKGSYQALSESRVNQTEATTDKQSHVVIRLDSVHILDKMTIEVSGEENFHRAAELYTNEGGQQRLLRKFWLSSTSLNQLNFNSIRHKELILKVYNKDDYPITVSNVEFKQLKRYVTAKLKREDQYVIKFGNAKIAAPEYDLVYFKHLIPKRIPTVGVDSIVYMKKVIAERKTHPANSSAITSSRERKVVVDTVIVADEAKVKSVAAEKKKEEESIMQHQIYIWVAIGILVFLLGYFSIRMLSDIRKSED